MKRFLSWVFLISFPFLLTTFLIAENLPKVEESYRSLRVVSRAAIPEEVSNQVQAQALSRDAAIVRGQTALLTYILQKKTHSKKTLAEAEIPSIDLQQTIRGYIKGARPIKTSWGDKECEVVLVLDKSQLKSILRKN